MRAENVTWIGEPSNEKRYNRWPQYTLWPFKTKFDGEDCDTTFYMNEVSHEVYLAEVVILEQLKLVQMSPETRKALITAIDNYGDKREEKGRFDVQEDWAESGEGV